MGRDHSGEAPARALEVRWSESPADVDAAFAIRRAVFMDEQGYTGEQEFDEADARAMHALALMDGVVVGTARLVLERDDLGAVAILGRVAVLPPFRGRGVGAALVAFAVRNATLMGPYVVRAGAQVRALGFWHHLGFERTGDAYMDFHVPHEWMELRLDR